MVSLEFFIDIILPVALWSRGRLSLQQKWVPGVFPGGKGGRCVRLTNLPSSCAVVMKSGNLNFLEPSGPLKACKGTALPFFTDWFYFNNPAYTTVNPGCWMAVFTSPMVATTPEQNMLPTSFGLWGGEPIVYVGRKRESLILETESKHYSHVPFMWRGAMMFTITSGRNMSCYMLNAELSLQ